MKNENLQDLILSVAKRGYSIRFRRPLGYDYLAIRLETELPNGTIVCHDHYTSFKEIDDTDGYSICGAIESILKEFNEMEKQ